MVEAEGSGVVYLTIEDLHQAAATSEVVEGAATRSVPL
jgi:hypothetical protein